MRSINKLSPLLPILCGLIAGICSYESLALPIHFSVPLALATALLGWLLPQHSLALTFNIISAFLFGNMRTAQQKHDYEYFYMLTQEKPFSLAGHILDVSAAPQSSLRFCITISSHAIEPQDNTWHNHNCTLRIYTNTPHLMIDDIILVENITCNKTTNANFAKYLMKEGIAGCIFVPKLIYTIKNHRNYSLYRWLKNKKQQLLKQCTRNLNKKTSTLFASLFLGEKQKYKKELAPMAEQFKAWGLSHYLARSGLHLVIFILLWQWLLTYIPLGFLIKQLILFTISYIYFVLSWSSISFIRALSTFAIIKISIYFNKQIHIAHTLILVCCATLITNPMQLFFLDFQLSFVLTLALIWFNYIFHKKQPLLS